MLNRSIAPVAFTTPQIHLQQAKTHYLKNGIPIHVINAGNLGVIKIEAIIRNAGSANENKAGAALLTANLRQQGTSSYSSDQIANAVASSGAFIDISPAFDNTSVTLYSLNKHLEDILPVFYEIIYKPTFPSEELDIQRNIQLSNLRVQNKKSSIVASKMFRGALFSEDHPYGKQVTEEHIEELSRQDLVNHYTLSNKNVELLIAGSITNEVLAAITRWFSDENYSDRLELSDEFQLPLQPQQLVHKEIKSAVQTSIRMGSITISKHHEDYPVLALTNHIFGGFFGSRLMKNIREEKGFTYGINSSIMSLEHATFFVIGSDISKKDKESALSEINNELVRLSDEVVSLNELQTAKNHLIGTFQSDLSSPFALAKKFKHIYLLGLTYDYYTSYINKIAAATPEQIMQAAKTYLQDIDTTVTVG